MNTLAESTHLDFTQMVSQKYTNLTKSEKPIANYLRKNLDESAFLSSAEVADRLGITEATVVRFARTLGFPSYPAMRTHLRTELADLAFIITFFDLNPSQQLVLDSAREVNCPAIMLTNTLEAVVSDKVNLVLATRRRPAQLPGNHPPTGAARQPVRFCWSPR